MSGRDFDFVKLRKDGQAQSAFQITCAACGVEDHFIQTGASRKPPIAAEKAFQRRDWFVGGEPRRDRCPQCRVKKTRQPELDKETAMAAPQAPAPLPRLVATAPREPTIDERKLINMELQVSYDEGKGCYSPGWSDHRVAEKLGCPRAWVAMVREFNFGPGADNEQLRELMALIAPVARSVAELDQAARKVADEARIVLKRAETTLASADAIALRLKEIERQIKPLRALVAP